MMVHGNATPVMQTRHPNCDSYRCRMVGWVVPPSLSTSTPSTLAILTSLLVSVTGDSAELYSLSGPVGAPFTIMVTPWSEETFEIYTTQYPDGLFAGPNS